MATKTKIVDDHIDYMIGVEQREREKNPELVEIREAILYFAESVARITKWVEKVDSDEALAAKVKSVVHANRVFDLDTLCRVNRVLLDSLDSYGGDGIVPLAMGDVLDGKLSADVGIHREAIAEAVLQNPTA